MSAKAELALEALRELLAGDSSSRADFEMALADENREAATEALQAMSYAQHVLYSLFQTRGEAKDLAEVIEEWLHSPRMLVWNHRDSTGHVSPSASVLDVAGESVVRTASLRVKGLLPSEAAQLLLDLTLDVRQAQSGAAREAALIINREDLDVLLAATHGMLDPIDERLEPMRRRLRDMQAELR